MQASALFRNSALSLACSTLFAAGAVAQTPAPAATPEHTFTANVGLFSEYIFRGISQTGGRPAVQGGFDYAHASGLYLGTWASNISWLEDFGLYNRSRLVHVRVRHISIRPSRRAAARPRRASRRAPRRQRQRSRHGRQGGLHRLEARRLLHRSGGPFQERRARRVLHRQRREEALLYRS